LPTGPNDYHIQEYFKERHLSWRKRKTFDEMTPLSTKLFARENISRQDTCLKGNT
jgi:hypothetical protein